MVRSPEPREVAGSDHRRKVMSTKVEISFVVGTSDEPNHRTDSRFRKVFEVEWPGRPMPGEIIEVDIGHPVQ